MQKFTYEIKLDERSGENIILRSDGAWIPQNIENKDYAIYLESLNDDTIEAE